MSSKVLEGQYSYLFENSINLIFLKLDLLIISQINFEVLLSFEYVLSEKLLRLHGIDRRCHSALIIWFKKKSEFNEWLLH